MAHIELPRALEDYFAFAETTPTRNGRRFVLSLPYFCGAGDAPKLDRLQWWFHLSAEQERQMGEGAIATLRTQATVKFQRHIERWLENTRQRIHGEEPIPRIDSIVLPAPEAALPASEAIPSAPEAAAAPIAPDVTATPGTEEPTPEEPATEEAVSWPAERVANG